MEPEKNLEPCSERVIYKCEIPLKLPSLNDFIHKCNYSRYEGGRMKRELEHDIGLYIYKLPKFNEPIKIHFTWVEGNKRRDLDNVASAKKFILDAMVKCGRLKDDNRRCVTGFTDSFEYGDEFKVILEISSAV